MRSFPCQDAEFVLLGATKTGDLLALLHCAAASSQQQRQRGALGYESESDLDQFACLSMQWQSRNRSPSSL